MLLNNELSLHPIELSIDSYQCLSESHWAAVYIAVVSDLLKRYIAMETVSRKQYVDTDGATIMSYISTVPHRINHVSSNPILGCVRVSDYASVNRRASFNSCYFSFFFRSIYLIISLIT